MKNTNFPPFPPKHSIHSILLLFITCPLVKTKEIESTQPLSLLFVEGYLLLHFTFNLVMINYHRLERVVLPKFIFFYFDEYNRCGCMDLFFFADSYAKYKKEKIEKLC